MQDHNIREDIACGAHLCVAAFHMSARDQCSDGDTANLSACVYCVDFAFCFCMECWLFINSVRYEHDDMSISWLKC